MQLLLTMVEAFGLTLIFECGLLLLCYPLVRTGGSRRQLLYICFLCNLLTNPAVNLIAALLGHSLPLIPVLELAVVAIEGIVYYLTTDCGRGKSLLLSLGLNAGSYLLGVLIFGF